MAVTARLPSELGAEVVDRPDALARPWQRPNLMIGLVIAALVVLTALLANVIAPHNPLTIDVPNRLQGPSHLHLAGTDELGRDILSRVIYASRISIEVAAISIGIGGFFGILIGTISAWSGGWVDMLLMRFMDIVYSFPAILLAIAIMGGLGTNITNAMIAIGIIFIPGFARLSRAAALIVLKQQYIDAARAIGMSPFRIVVSEILPNIMPPLLVQGTQGLAFAVVVEAALSFLGLGTQPPDPSWGNMLREGRGFMQYDVWMAIAPGLAIFVTVLGFNLLGDGLRDYYDPRLRA